MAKKVLSVEVGQQVTKAVVVDYLRKNPHVYNAFSFDTPPGAMEDGYLKNKDAIAQMLKAQIRENGVKEKDVVFSIASSKIASREIVVPYVPENKIDGLINATAQDYFPVNMEEYTLAYNVLDIVKEGDKKSLKLLLLAAPDTLIQNYYGLADSLGMHVESIDYYGNGSMQVLQKHIGSGYCVSVQISSLNTMVSVLRESQQIMQRTIPYGVNTIIDTMMEQQALGLRDKAEAMEMLCRENIIFTSLDYDDIDTVRSTRMTDDQISRSNYNRDARKAVTDAVGGILLSVIRVVDYFNSRYPDCQLTYVYITGMGVKIRGIEILFEKEMDLPVRPLEKLTNITFARGFARSLQDQTEYIAAIGAAIEPVGFRMKSMTAKESQAESMRIVHLVFGVMVVAAVALVGIAWIQLHSAQSKNAELKEKKADLEYINAVYQENEAAKSAYEEAATLHAATKHKNEDLITLLEDIEANLPQEMVVSNFTSNAEGITMTIETKTKISVARMLIALEEHLKSLTDIVVPAVSMNEKDNGSVTYSFTVTAQYAASEEENAEGETGNDAVQSDNATAQ
ncbi:MAG: pilus assembly protein PilM [Lachnospiraceae bacterium]|nr:pilus assembly protein PilM [Lachnospiraceae bacterium]